MNLRRYLCCICDYYEKKRIKEIYIKLSSIEEVECKDEFLE